MPDNDPQSADEIASYREKFRLIMSWVVILILVGFGVFTMIGLANFHNTPGNYWMCLVYEQFPVVVGLPMAGLGALFVTLILKISTGDLEFEIGVLKFKGAAAPIVFWVLCFSVITTAVGALWQPATAGSQKPYCGDFIVDASKDYPRE